MTSALFRWHVYRDRYPLHAPELLGELEAPTLAAAKNEAARRFPGVATLIQSAASARVRPVTALPLPHEVTAPKNYRGPRRGKYRQQLDAFTQAKRAAHEARQAQSTPTETGP